jgi:hypothetical protein
MNGGPGSAAAVGNTGSRPAVQTNPDQLRITSQLEQLRGKDLPGWLLR